MASMGPLAKGWFCDSGSFFGTFPLGMSLWAARTLSSCPALPDTAHSCLKWHIVWGLLFLILILVVWVFPGLLPLQMAHHTQGACKVLEGQTHFPVSFPW